MSGRGYQFGYSDQAAAMYDMEMRERKARTMVAVLADHYGREKLGTLAALTVGGSTGALDNHLADHLGEVNSVDIDAPAVGYAHHTYHKPNLYFSVGDAMQLAFGDASFDVVICSQVYEHVPSAERMMEQIFRVLKPGGLCYFAANNRIMWNEPHYHLPLLSVVPRPLAHLYVRAAGRGSRYYEKHYSYWGLRHLTRHFVVHDYTVRIASDPERYAAGYMLRPGSPKAVVAAFMARRLRWLMPGYIWLLEKPAAGAVEAVSNRPRRDQAGPRGV